MGEGLKRAHAAAKATRTPSQKRGDALAAGKKVTLKMPARPTYGWRRMRLDEQGQPVYGLSSGLGTLVVAEAKRSMFDRSRWSWLVRDPDAEFLTGGEASDETTAMLSATVAFLNKGKIV